MLFSVKHNFYNALSGAIMGGAISSLIDVFENLFEVNRTISLVRFFGTVCLLIVGIATCCVAYIVQTVEEKYYSQIKDQHRLEQVHSSLKELSDDCREPYQCKVKKMVLIYIIFLLLSLILFAVSAYLFNASSLAVSIIAPFMKTPAPFLKGSSLFCVDKIT
jgi:uncharacterized BrkB/YihY/UPF0761 family membrane protein